MPCNWDGWLDPVKDQRSVAKMNLRRGVWCALGLAVAGARAGEPMITLPLGPAKTAEKPGVAAAGAGFFHFEPPAIHYTPATVMERAFEDRLVRMQDGVARRVEPAQLAGVKFYALYFAAGWNASCRAFTEKLAEAYPKLRELYPEFELVMVSRDQSRAAMVTSMHIEQMPWLAVRWDLNVGATEITRYGRGIPCLVLIDAEGKVLADTYREGALVGSDAVLKDIWKTLFDYRRGHPAVKVKG